ncbi:MAG: cysteine synthase A [Paludibacteraceae bacterium]|nr:cysteine synthase A [Paludibacteraceae bacterium]
MAKIYNDLTELVGHTPLLHLQRLSAHYGIDESTRVLAKLEYFNPGGSVKDRVALNMIKDAERRGVLQPGGTIIEPTSGNTGVGLAWIARVRGYEAVIVMPDSMSHERQQLLRAAGAQLVLTPGAEGMTGAIAEAELLRDSTPNSIILGQFSNPANPEAHSLTTAQEIWDDTDGHVDFLVAGVGTGGTLCGTSRQLKVLNPSLQAIAVEPAESSLLTGGTPSPHGIQGIGANFVPQNYDSTVVDHIIQVSTEQAMHVARELSHHEGLIVGISSGAAIHAALQLALTPETQGKCIVAVLPDTGERYLSTGVY